MKALEDMAFRFAVALMCVLAALTIPWFLTAPRTPGGIVCQQSTPLTSFWAFLRAQREVGCAFEDAVVQEKPLAWRQTFVPVAE